jgi:hypothetical protein
MIKLESPKWLAPTARLSRFAVLARRQSGPVVATRGQFQRPLDWGA